MIFVIFFFKSCKYYFDCKCFIFYFKKNKKNIFIMFRVKVKVLEYLNWIMNFIYELFIYMLLIFLVVVKV